jgi:hypothetical protein
MSSATSIEESNRKYIEGIPGAVKAPQSVGTSGISAAYPNFGSGYSVSSGGNTTIARDLEISRSKMPTAPSRDEYRQLSDGTLEYTGPNPMYAEEMESYESRMAEREAANERIVEIMNSEKAKAKKEGRKALSIDELATGSIGGGSNLFKGSAGENKFSTSSISRESDLAIVRGEIESSAAERAEASARLMQYNIAKSSVSNPSISNTGIEPQSRIPSANSFGTIEEDAPSRRMRSRIDISDGLSLNELNIPSANKGIIDDMKSELEEVGLKLRDVAKIDFAKISYDQLSKDFGEGFADVAKKAVQIALEEISKSRN